LNREQSLRAGEIQEMLGSATVCLSSVVRTIFFDGGDLLHDLIVVLHPLRRLRVLPGHGRCDPHRVWRAGGGGERRATQVSRATGRPSGQVLRSQVASRHRARMGTVRVGRSPQASATLPRFARVFGRRTNERAHSGHQRRQLARGRTPSERGWMGATHRRRRASRTHVGAENALAKRRLQPNFQTCEVEASFQTK
jgi:hypothetical protein